MGKIVGEGNYARRSQLQQLHCKQCNFHRGQETDDDIIAVVIWPSSVGDSKDDDVNSSLVISKTFVESLHNLHLFFDIAVKM